MDQWKDNPSNQTWNSILTHPYVSLAWMLLLDTCWNYFKQNCNSFFRQSDADRLTFYLLTSRAHHWKSLCLVTWHLASSNDVHFSIIKHWKENPFNQTKNSTLTHLWLGIDASYTDTRWNNYLKQTCNSFFRQSGASRLLLSACNYIERKHTNHQ